MPHCQARRRSAFRRPETAGGGVRLERASEPSKGAVGNDVSGGGRGAAALCGAPGLSNADGGREPVPKILNWVQHCVQRARAPDRGRAPRALRRAAPAFS
jgi:hypothetical protein